MSNASVTRLHLSSQIESRKPTFGKTIGGFLGDVGSTLGSALNLGTLKGSSSYSGKVGLGDSDLFRFDLDRGGDTKLSLINLLASSVLGGGLVSAVLFNASGNLIRSLGSTQVSPGSNNGFSVKDLDPGTYYVRLNSLDGDPVKYRLNLNNSSSAVDDFGTTSIGDLRKPFKSNAEVCKNEPQFYSFKFGQTGKLKITLRNRLKSDFFAGFLRNRSITATLFDSSKTALKDYTLKASPGKLKGLTISNLKGGAYYMKVETKLSSKVPFTLNLAPSFNT